MKPELEKLKSDIQKEQKPGSNCLSIHLGNGLMKPLSGSEIREVLSSLLADNQSTTRVCFTNSPIRLAKIQALTEALPGLENTNVTQLSFLPEPTEYHYPLSAYHGFTFDEETSETFKQVFSSLKKTKITKIGLKISRASKSGEFKKALSGLIGTPVKIIDLSMNDAFFEKLTADELANIFSGFKDTNVTHVVLTSNARFYPDYQAGDIKTALSGFIGTPVKTLDLSSNVFGRRTGDELNIVFSGLKDTNVNKIIFSYNELDRMSSTDLKTAFSGLAETQVTYIDLSANALFRKTEDDLKNLFSSFKNTPVRIVDLSNNWFDDRPAKEMLPLLMQLALIKENKKLAEWLREAFYEKPAEWLRIAFSGFADTQVSTLIISDTLPVENLAALQELEGSLPNIISIYIPYDEIKDLPEENRLALKAIFPNLQTVFFLEKRQHSYIDHRILFLDRASPFKNYNQTRRLIPCPPPRLEDFALWKAAELTTAFSRANSIKKEEIQGKIAEMPTSQILKAKIQSTFNRLNP